MGWTPPYFEGYAYPPFWIYLLWIFFGLYLATAKIIGWHYPLIKVQLPETWPLGSNLLNPMPCTDYLFNFYAKLPILLFDALTAITLYNFVKHRWEERKAFTVFKLYWLNPYVIWINSIWGMFDVIAVFFSLAAVIYLIEPKPLKSAAALGLGIATKIYPILFLPIFWLYMKRAGYSLKKQVNYTLISIGTVCGLCLPFLIYNYKSFTYSIFVFQGNRLAGGINGYSVFWLLAEYDKYYDYFYLVSISPFIRTIFVIALSAFYILFYLLMNHRKLIENVMAILAIVLVFSPITHEQHFLWIVPFLLILYVNQYVSLKTLSILLYTSFIFVPYNCLYPLFFEPLFHNFGMPYTLPFTHETNLIRLGVLAFSGVTLSGALLLTTKKTIFSGFSRILSSGGRKFNFLNQRSIMLFTFIGLLTLPIFYSLNTPAIPHQSSDNKLVLAYYYSWYENQRGQQNWFSEQGYAQLTPLLGYYDSRNSAVIEQHIKWAKYAGIDGFIISLWEPRSTSDAGLRRFIEKANELNFNFAIMLELWSRDLYRDIWLKHTREINGVRILVSSPVIPLTEQNLAKLVTKLVYISKYFKEPSYLYRNNKPMVYLYDAYLFEKDQTKWLWFWSELRARIKAKTGMDLFIIVNSVNNVYQHDPDAIHLFIKSFDSNTWYTLISNWMKTPEDLHHTIESTIDKYHLYAEGTSKISAAVIPGYHDFRPKSPNLGRSLDIYDQQWRLALKCNSDIIFITTWNEFYEGTTIEPTAEDSFIFLNSTAYWTSQYKR